MWSSQHNKAFIAAVMSILTIIDQWWGVSIGFVSEEWITMVLAVLTPIFVYFVPNREPGWVTHG